MRKRNKILLIILASLVGLVVVLQLALNSAFVQNKLKNMVASLAQEQLHAEVTVGHFRWGFPKTVKVQDVLIQKNETDSLLSLGELAVTVRLWPLLKKQVVLQHIEVQSLSSQIDQLLSAIPTDTTSTHEQPQPEKETSQSWTIDARELTVETSYIGYYSKEAGMNLTVDVGTLNLQLATLNLDSFITVKSVNIENSKVLFQSYAVAEVKDTTSSSFAKILLEKASLENSNFTYIAEDSTLVLDAGGKLLEISDFLLGLDQSSITLNKGKTEDFHCDLRMDEAPDTIGAATGDMNWGTSLWRIKGKSLDLQNFRFSMEDVQQAAVPGHFDPAHLRFENFTGNLNDFLINTDTLILSIRNLSGNEHHGLNIKSLNAKMDQKDGVFSISDMAIKTEESTYTASLSTQINPTNYNEIAGKSVDFSLDVKGKNWHDIDYFYPLQQSLGFISPQFLQSEYRLNTSLKGDFDHLDISSFSFAALQSTQLNLSGSLQNLMSDDLPSATIYLHELTTSSKDVRKAMKGLPHDFGGFKIPQMVELVGEYKMQNEQHVFSGKLQSSVGEMDFQQVKIKLGEEPSYALKVLANLDNLAEIHNDWEKAFFKVDATYKGPDVWTSKADVKLQVDSFRYLAHTYHQVGLKAAMDTGYYKMDFTAKDTALYVQTHAEGNLTEKLKSIQLDAEVRNLDFRLFSGKNDSLRLAGVFNLNGKFENEKDIIASLDLKQLDFYFKDSLYQMKPAKMEFSSHENSTLFTLESSMYGLNFSADANVDDLVAGLQTLPQYYMSNSMDTVRFELPQFELSGKLELPQEFASHLLPGIPAFDVLTVSGKHDRSNDEIFVEATIPKLTMNSLEMDNVALHADGSSQKMNVVANTGIKMGDVLKGNVAASANFHDSRLISNIRYTDSNGDEFLNFSALLDTLPNGLKVHIIPDSLTLGYNPWSVDADNRIVIRDSRIDLHHIKLYQNNQSIAIQQDSIMDKSDVKLVVENLNVGSTAKLFALDTVASGILNAEVAVQNMQTNLSMTGNLHLDSTRLYGIDFGKIELTDFLYNDSIVAANLLMDGDNQLVKMKGSIHQMEKVEANLDIQKLKLAALNNYMPGEVQEAKGIMQAQLNVSGNLDLPYLNGFLSFSDAGLKILSLNQYFSFGNEKVEVKDNVLKFNGFSIQNERNQAAKMNGEISLISGNKVYNNLQIATDNMEWINSTQKDNDIFYGLLKAKSNIQLKGPSESVKIKANVTVDKSTDLTYVFPDKLTINDNHGIVSYTPYVNDTTPLPSAEKNEIFWGFGAFDDVESRLEIEPGTRFKMHFDAGGENFLDASLSGVLNYYMKGINNEITGVLEINNGQLHYNIPMVTVNNFKLEPGSTITLSNDIYNPYLSIIASSNIRASTESLMPDYKKVMTFKVLLYMEGELNNMKLRFDISTETGDAIVSSTLSQLSEKERNVNALNLLVRGTFVLSLQGPGAGATSAAQAQIDKIYADGLNSIVADNIKFVDLHFDVQSFEDYGEGGGQVFRRNYYYEVGKSFFNERARINYKGRLEMMDNRDMENANSSFVQNQLEVEVKMNKEGNLTAVFFRKDEYEGLLEGQIIETGAGFRLSNSFYSIKDIFVNEDNKRAKELRDQRLKNEQ